MAKVPTMLLRVFQERNTMKRMNFQIMASSWLCLLFVFFTILPAYSQEIKLPHGGEPMYNVDLPGADIFHFSMDAPSPGMFDLRQSECSQACWQNKDCVAWTYVRPNTIQGPKGNCWLKNSVPAKKSNNCCASGTIGEADTDRPGGDYTHFDNVMGMAVTPQLCQTICQNQEKCMAWTFVKPGTIQGPKGVCWLKDTIPPPVKNSSCISGYFTIEVIK
jgi:hypothetical protein